MAATRCEFWVAPNLKMFLMKYFKSLPNLVFSPQNAQLFCYAPVLIPGRGTNLQVLARQTLTKLYRAKLFVTIFHSFKAGIANAISSFKRQKISLLMDERHFQIHKMTSRAFTTNYLINFSGILFTLKLAQNPKYTVPAAIGVKSH